MYGPVKLGFGNWRESNFAGDGDLRREGGGRGGDSDHQLSTTHVNCASGIYNILPLPFVIVISKTFDLYGNLHYFFGLDNVTSDIRILRNEHETRERLIMCFCFCTW